MAGSTQPAFRIDVAINDLLVHGAPQPPMAPVSKGLTLPEPAVPQRVLKWLWKQACRGFKGGARSFED